jgi:glycosyltransferase involved in cell wall biosynthesis
MSERPTIAVVVAVHQGAETIAEALDSALSQDPPPDETIVADDGSTDRLEQALEPYLDRIDVLRLPHAGVAATRNAACRHASSEFVLFLDADDLLLPGKLAALGQLAAAEPEPDVLGTDLWFERDGRRVGRFTDANPFPAIERQRRTILERCFVAQATIRRSRLLALGGFDESLRSGSDWDGVLRLVLNGSHAGFDEAPLATYRIRGDSLTSSRTDTFRDRARILEKALANPDLGPGERPTAERMLAAQQARVVLADAQAAVAESRPDLRRRCWELARTSGCAPRDRLWALAVLASPRALRPLLGRGVDATSQLSRRLPGAGSKR